MHTICPSWWAGHHARDWRRAARKSRRRADGLDRQGHPWGTRYRRLADALDRCADLFDSFMMGSE